MKKRKAEGYTVFVTVGTTKFDQLIEAIDSRAFAEACVAQGYRRLLVQSGRGTYYPAVLESMASSSSSSRGPDENQVARRRSSHVRRAPATSSARSCLGPIIPPPPHSFVSTMELQGDVREFSLVVSGGREKGSTVSLEVTIFEYATSLQPMFEAADLVVTHAGAGSTFEALSVDKLLIAIPNPSLMGNHQKELADHLAAMGHLVTCAPSTVDIVRAVETLADVELVPYRAVDQRETLAAAMTVCAEQGVHAAVNDARALWRRRLLLYLVALTMFWFGVRVILVMVG